MIDITPVFYYVQMQHAISTLLNKCLKSNQASKDVHISMFTVIYFKLYLFTDLLSIHEF